MLCDSIGVFTRPIQLYRTKAKYAELPIDLKTEQNTKAILNRLRKHTIDNIDIWAGQELYEWRMSDLIEWM